MKRCSECHFTFEDYQQVCDFDGTILTEVPEPSALSHRGYVPAVSQSRVRRLLRSPISLGVFALAGVVLSALLVGYYDSMNQPNSDVPSNAESRSAEVSLVPPSQVETPSQLATQTERPRSITTQRRITAAEASASKASSMPSSMIVWPTKQHQPRSSRSRSAPSNSRLSATSTSKQVATKRRNEKTTRQSLARNHKTPGSLARQHGWRGREPFQQKKDSKVVAMLKKTGSILKRPFEMIAGR